MPPKTPCNDNDAKSQKPSNTDESFVGEMVIGTLNDLALDMRKTKTKRRMKKDKTPNSVGWRKKTKGYKRRNRSLVIAGHTMQCHANIGNT